MSEIRTQVQFVDIDEDMAGQRIDNFLRNQLKDIPKSMIYRIVRKGEVRVNKKRIKAEYKLKSRRSCSYSSSYGRKERRRRCTKYEAK